MQSINLYLPELRPKKEWMTAWTAVLICAGFCVLLLGSTILNTFELKRYEQSIIVYENQRVAKSERIAVNRERLPKADAARLDQEIQNLKSTLRHRMLVNDVIEGQSLGNEYGYSARLEDLAASSSPAISIEQFRFARGAGFVELKGETKAPEKVAVFIEKLKRQDSFLDAGFGALSLVEEKNKRNYKFALGFDSLFQGDGELAVASP